MKVKDCIVGKKVLSTFVMSTFDSFTFTKQFFFPIYGYSNMNSSHGNKQFVHKFYEEQS